MDEPLTFEPPRRHPSHAVADRPRELGFELRWLTSLLWPAADVRLAPSRVPPGRRVAEAYSVVPNASCPRLLVPLVSPSVTDDLTRLIGGGTASIARARRAARARLGLWSYPRLVVFFDRDPRPDELLTGRLREVFDRPDAMPAISWSGSGLDRIPIVHAVSLEGEILGVAKVGWSAPTRELVANEAAVLRYWERRRPRTFTVPTLVYDGRWGEHVLTVATPDPKRDRRFVARGGYPIESLREVSRTGGIGLAPLTEMPWWPSAVRRAAGDPAMETVLRWMADLHGRRLVWHGSSHGDWTARTVRPAAGAMHVSGWEHAHDGVPLGLDAVHFAYEAARRRDRETGRAMRGALVRARPILRRLGIPRQDDDLLAACYLVERLIRARHSADRGRPGAARDAALDELRRRVGRA